MATLKNGAPTIYFDNNATTFMSKKTQDTLNKLQTVGNPSSFFPRSQNVKAEIEQRTREVLSKVLGSERVFNQFQVIFTSGASEANATLVRMVADNKLTLYTFDL